MQHERHNNGRLNNSWSTGDTRRYITDKDPISHKTGIAIRTTWTLWKESFKQWRSRIPPISAKRTTNHLSPQIIEHKKTTIYNVGILAPGLRHVQTWGSQLFDNWITRWFPLKNSHNITNMIAYTWTILQT